MLSLRSAMPILTSNRSTCCGRVPLGASCMMPLAAVTADESGSSESRPSSHLMRSTFDGRDMLEARSSLHTHTEEKRW